MLKETIGINYKYIEIILYSPNANFNVIFYDNSHITIILMYHTFFNTVTKFRHSIISLILII